MEERRIWDQLSPSARTALGKFYTNALTGGDGNRVILVDSEGAVVTSLGGGGAGGGSIVYSNAANDFSIVSNPGTKTLTVSGLPFTLEEINIVGGRIKKLDALNDVSDIDLGNVVVAGITGASLITLSDEDNFATGDTIYAEFIGPDKSYDRQQDLDKVNIYNQDYSHYVDPENWSLTDVTGLQRRIINMDSYSSFNFQYSYSQTGDQTGTMKIYCSNIDSADTSSIVGWVDRSSKILGAASIEIVGTGSTGGYIESTGPTMPLKYMLELDVTASGTGVDMISDVYIRKFY